MLRTGIAVLAMPLSALIATSKDYDVASILHFLVPEVVLCVVLVVIGVCLKVNSGIHMRRYDRLVRVIKRSHDVSARIIR